MFPFEQGQCSFAHILHTESELAHYDWSRSRSAKTIHRNHVAPVTNVAIGGAVHPR